MTTTKRIKKLLRTAVLPLAMIPAASSMAAISMPGGDIFGNGDFSEVFYGTTGTAYVTSFLYTGVNNSTLSFGESGTWSGFGLTNSYAAGALGDSLWTIDYSITNTRDDLTFNDLRLMVNVQADGSGTFNDFTSQVWDPQLPGDPDRRQIGDFAIANLANQIIANNGVTDGGDACGASVCDADLALQWNLASLAPGETWTVRVNLLDDPSLLLGGGRYLRADSVDTLNTHLIFGNAQLVPEPQTYAMLVVGLGLLAYVRMRRRT